jgi:tetratricopeptide (TPR) repeat protein
MPSTASEYFDLGVTHYENNQFEQAIANFDRAIGLAPDLYSAYHNRALAKCEIGRYDSALEDIDVVIQHDPEDAEAYCNRGYIRIQSGAPAAALDDLNTAVNINPQYAAALVTRGKARFQLRQIKTALADFDRAIAADPENAEAYAERAALWNSMGDAQGAVEDYNEAINCHPESTLFYLERGRLYAGALGEKTLASADFNRFLALATQPEFLTHCNEIFDFYSANPAPFLIRRMLREYSDFDHFPMLHPVVDAAREQCGPMQMYLNWLDLQKLEQRDPATYRQLQVIVQFYMGDPATAYLLDDSISEDPDFSGTALHLMGLYYFIESAKLIHEPYEAVLAAALDEIRAQGAGFLTRKTPRDLYYAGLLLFANGRFVEADEYLEQAISYLPAAYLQIRTQQALGIEPDQIEARIAMIRTREAGLSPEHGYLHGFSRRYFKTETSDFLAPFLQYAHYREIENVLTVVQTAGESAEHRDLWAAFQWPADELRWADWMIRREALSSISKQLPEIRRNRERYLKNNPGANITTLEEAFVRQLEQDDWAGTLHDKFDDFQRSAGLMPDLRAQLAALVSGADHPEANAKRLLVDYFYLRGNLSVYDVMLMYAYIGFVQPTPEPDTDQPLDAGQRIVDGLFDPLTPAGETLTAATAGALIHWLKSFRAAERPADDTGLDVAGENVMPGPGYEAFTDAFLRYLGQQRETFGMSQFDERYPLEGFFDWGKNRGK